MLPKPFRLKLTGRVNWPDKQEIYSPIFKLVYRRRDQESPKIALIVTGKAGKAAERNRIRRLLTESVRSHIKSLPKNLEAVLIVGRPIKEVDYEKIDHWVTKSLSKIS